jgi:AraC-like DNA-binding protein
MIEVDTQDIGVTDHAQFRYCERIVGPETIIGEKKLIQINRNPITRHLETNNQIKRYVLLYREQITNNIRNIFLRSDFIYRGAFGGDGTTRDYYLHDDIVLISEANREHPCIVTLYRAELGFPEREANRNFAQWLKEVICTLRNEVEITKNTQNQIISQRQAANDVLEEQIMDLTAKLKDLRDAHTTNCGIIKNSQAKINSAVKSLEEKAHLLCNCVDYRKDMMSAE